MVPGALIAVYRARNGEPMRRLADEATAAGWPVGLWALDETVPELASRTVGTGAGPKFDLLNAALAGISVSEDAWLVVSDDDYTLPTRGLADFLAVAEAAGFGIAQPAHRRGSGNTFPITTRRVWCTARWTSFVEIGPVFAVAPAWRSRLTPFPDDLGMGWGLELAWHRLESEGLRLGVVDRVPLRHPEEPGTHYEVGPEMERLMAHFAEHGVAGWDGVQRTRGRWPVWRRSAPWL